MATFQAPLQNVAVAFLADGNGFGKGLAFAAKCSRNTCYNGNLIMFRETQMLHAAWMCLSAETFC